jgi:hypothetical protein
MRKINGGNDLFNLNTKTGITSNEIKLIAIIAMTLDHAAWTFFPGYRTDWPIILHIIGRLTAPIMIYLIAEGCYYTKNIKKYILRLFVLAFLSHFAYKLLLTPGRLNSINFNEPFYLNFIPFRTGLFDQTSVIWAYALGATALSIDMNKIFIKNKWLKLLIITVCFLLAFIADWSCPAALSIAYIGRNRGNFKKQILWFVVWMTLYTIIYIIFINKIYGIIQLCVFLAIPLIKTYNGERGNLKGMKWFFYIYYPLHLTIFGIIGIYING